MRSFIPLIFAAAAFASGSCAKLPSPADKLATKETVTLFRSLYKLQNEGVMYGHQDDLMYGRTWWYEKNRSDTKDFTGDYPAVAGFELGHLELGDEREKLTALSETGGRKGMDNWWSAVLLPVVSKYPVGYVLTWRHAYMPRGFRPKPGMPAVQMPAKPFPDDFMNFYNSQRTLFLKEIQEADIYKRK